VTAASFTDVTAAPGTYTYMVRAVGLLTNASGSYWNASQGAFTTVTVINLASPVILQARPGPEGLILEWNSQAALTYRIQATDSLQLPHWTDISGTVAATGAHVSWNVPFLQNGAKRFFRVATP
jgi:hypothetical protein